MNRWLGPGLLLAILAALALRCPQLEDRPMHNDEAINASKIQGLWERGIYKYDPNEYHGPSLYYATLPVIFAAGSPDFAHLTEGTLRMVTVIFGVAMIALLALLADALPTPAVWVAGLLTAVSPAFVFYSRYYIHEMLLVCFTLLSIAAGWRFLRTARLGWAALTGGAIGLMSATKETFVLPLGAMAAAGIAVLILGRREGGSPTPLFTRPMILGLATASVTALAVFVVLFTSFFTNAAGPVDAIRTYFPWLHRASGHSPHVHPWDYYLHLLFYFHVPRGPRWSEGLILGLGVVGLAGAITRLGLAGVQVGFARFVGVYTIVLTAAYSAIAYKTPWCMLGFLSGWVLLAGVGAAMLLTLPKRGWQTALIACALVAGMAQLGWQARRAAVTYSTDRKNPYVYAQTVPDVVRMVEQVKMISRSDPAGSNMVIKVMVPESDYWPLPWYLRGFKKVGWWDRVPEQPWAPVIISGVGLRAGLDDRSEKKWLMVGFYELRPGQFLELYVQYDLWRKHIENSPRPVESDEAGKKSENRPSV